MKMKTKTPTNLYKKLIRMNLGNNFSASGQIRKHIPKNIRKNNMKIYFDGKIVNLVLNSFFNLAISNSSGYILFINFPN